MIVFDAEIEKAISLDGIKEPGIEYCNGFHDFENMGISVICAYDYDEKCSRVFLGDNLDDFKCLVQHTIDQGEMVIGFNSIDFDNKLCAANGIRIPKKNTYDLLVEIWRSAGLPTTYNPEFHKGYSIAKCAEANRIDVDKRHDSARAPMDFQKGRIGKVIDHCMTDVMMLKRLIDQVRFVGGLYDPKTKKLIQINNPEQWRNHGYPSEFRSL
jgi:hypothetical protein